jgi:hypothetical protein
MVLEQLRTIFAERRDMAQALQDTGEIIAYLKASTQAEGDESAALRATSKPAPLYIKAGPAARLAAQPWVAALDQCHRLHRGTSGPAY